MKIEPENKALSKRNTKHETDFEEYLAKQDTATQQRLKKQIWRGQNKVGANAHGYADKISTGFSGLDKQIGGWPLGITTEIGLPYTGIGELRLLIPAIKQLQNRSNGPNQILFICPPLIPFAPALKKAGLKLSLLTIVTTPNINDALWASEEALKSNSCAAAICWTQSYKLSNHQMRRLQLAAELHSSWYVLLRNQRCLDESSVSGLRLKINTDKRSKLHINIVKQLGKWGDQQCTLSLPPHYENWQKLPVDLWPVPKWQEVAQPRQLKLIHKNEIKNVSVLTGNILVAHA